MATQSNNNDGWVDVPQAQAPASQTTQAGNDGWADVGSPEQPHRSWGEALLSGAESLPGGIAKSVGALATAKPDFLPEGTVLFPGMSQALGVGEGLTRLGAGELGIGGEKNAAIANAFNQQKKGMYLSGEEGFKNAIAEHPEDVLGDLSMVTPLGEAGLARLGTTGARLAEVSKFATNPLYAAGKVGAWTLPKVGSATAEGAGILSGSGGESYRIGEAAGEDASNAGFKNSVDAKAYRNALAGNDTADATVYDARQGISQIKNDQSVKYDNDLSKRVQNIALPGFKSQMQNVIDRMKSEMTDPWSGRTYNPDGLQALNDIEGTLNDWYKGLNANGKRMSLYSADKLKQLVTNIASKNMDTNPGAFRAADNVASSMREWLRQASPEYGKVMDDWKDTHNFIEELERTLSLSPTNTTDTAIRKLQSALRDGVNTGMGQRKKLVDDLNKYVPGLRARLAGQSIHPIAPRGVSRLGPVSALSGLGGLFFGGPHGAILGAAAGAAGDLLMSSPRVGGTVAYGIGRAAPYVRGAYRKTLGSPFATRAMLAGSNLSPFNSGSPSDQSPFQ